jgi:glycosyltransferase involved in cell wall biosynthesis
LLVIIGIQGPETTRIHHLIEAMGLARQVVLLCGVSDAELQWFYARCELLLAPSFVEGFGLPVVEAMLNHCRVVCSDIPAFREVGGPYCYYASLEHSAEEAFANAARSALKSIRFRASSADRFAGAHIADAYLRLYAQLRRGCSVISSFSDRDLHPSLARERGQL